jgi:nitroreductase
MNLLLQRQSIRQYTEEPVSQEKVTKLLQAAMQAPSATNQQPWDFIVVDDKKILTELSKTSKGAWMLADAPLGIIVVMRDGGRAPLMRQQDCAAAVQNILLEAVQLGLGAVWIGVYPKEERYTYINNLLGINEGCAFAQIAIGHPNEQKEVILRYDESRIHYNKW